MQLLQEALMATSRMFLAGAEDCAEGCRSVLLLGFALAAVESGQCQAPALSALLTGIAVSAGATYSELIAALIPLPAQQRASQPATGNNDPKRIKNAFKGAKQVFHDADKLV